jgi:K+:H+ antiporter
MQAPSEAIFLAQIVLLLLVGRLMGEAMQRIGQPAVMGQLIAGILLGPSVFGAIWPEAQRAVFAANPEQKSMPAWQAPCAGSKDVALGIFRLGTHAAL